MDMAVSPALALYEDALGRPEDGALVAEDAAGVALTLPVSRWTEAVGPADEPLLERAVGPVLDVGCGPGRYLHALRARGIDAVGVDVSPVAVRLARQQGASALEGSIFGQVPDAGRWRSALLADGNIGIGGHPAALLGRVVDLLAPDGRVLVELAPPGTGASSMRLRLRAGDTRSSWFDWAQVAVDAIDEPAREAGLLVEDCWSSYGRWFADLRPAAAAERSRTA